MKFNGFRFSDITTHKIDFAKINQSILIEDALNEHLNIKNYSNTIVSLNCFYISVEPHNTIHRPYKRYLPKRQIIRWFLRLSYTDILLAPIDEVVHYMAAAYLEAIESYFKNFKQDFDGKRFYEDVKALFTQKGWIKSVETLPCNV